MSDILNRLMSRTMGKSYPEAPFTMRITEDELDEIKATIEKLKGLVTDYFESMSETSNGHDFSVAKEALIKAIKAGES